MTKSDTIKQTLKETKLRRSFLTPKVYELKIDSSSLSQISKKFLYSVFREAKYLYNHILGSQEDIPTFDTKLTQVSVKVKDIFEIRKLQFISSQMKQSVKDRMFQNIINLSKAKTKGIRIGSLKFKSHLDSIPLKQPDVTFKIDFNKQRIRIQGNKQYLRVKGLSQVPQDSEIANANLIQKASGFYIHLTVFQNKEEKVIPDTLVGIDFGCNSQLTLSNSISLTFQVPVSKRIKKLDRKIMKNNRPRSNNKYKDQLKRRKEYERLTNIKTDIRNKVVSVLTHNFKYIGVQDESIKAWKASGHGKKIQNSGIGGIISALKTRAHTPVIVDKFFPSTQLCPVCSNKQKLRLDERIFSCQRCSYTEDRDVKSAICIEQEALKQIPPEQREFITPVSSNRDLFERTEGDLTSTLRMCSIFNKIPHVLAQVRSLNQEAHEFIRG